MSSSAKVISSQAGMKILFSFMPCASTFSRACANASVQSLPAFKSCASDVFAEPVPPRRPATDAPPRNSRWIESTPIARKKLRCSSSRFADGNLVLDIHQSLSFFDRNRAAVPPRQYLFIIRRPADPADFVRRSGSPARCQRSTFRGRESAASTASARRVRPAATTNSSASQRYCRD